MEGAPGGSRGGEAARSRAQPPSSQSPTLTIRTTGEPRRRTTCPKPISGREIVPEVAGVGKHHPICVFGRRGSARDRKSTRLNSSHVRISYAVFCLKKKRHSSSLRR